ncbi:MAG: B12-binding domain-containing radical SAM protein [Deltaproteobacteria bacterium]|nr:B12-binding domain-containing radical SAM protein [Deltaproteobacteria bacterium]
MRTLTLPYLAGMTPPDWDASIRIDALDPVAGDEPADLVAMTAMTQRAPRAYQIAEKFRRRGIPVVLGGAHVDLLPEEGERHADAVAVGEVEAIWPDILRDAEEGTLRSRYQAPALPAMANLARPRFDLIKNARYYTLLWPVQTTRGCPYRCNYCTVTTIYGAKYRHRPVEEVVEDIKAIRKHTRYIFFVDDNLTPDKAYATELFEALIPLDISWSAQMTLRFAEDEKLLRLAARSGFQMVVSGIENANEENLSSVNKSFNKPKRYRELLRRYRKNGVIVLAGMILGFDTETEDTIAQNLRFMLDEKLQIISLYLLTPFPGTPIFEQLEHEGRLLTKDWSRYDSYSCVYRPKHLTPERLTEMYWDVCRKVTTVPAILRRFTPPPLPRARTFIPDAIAGGLVFMNNLVLFRRDARRGVPPQV